MTAPPMVRPLVGWQAIAKACGVSVNTAIKWYREQGLPAKKIGGARVMLWADLETWLRAK